MKDKTYWNIKVISIIFACLVIVISCSHPSPLMGADKGDGKRIQAKAAEMQRLVPGWIGAGGSMERMQALGRKMNSHFDRGDFAKGEVVLDKMLAIIKGEKSFNGKVKAAASVKKPSPLAHQGSKGSKKWTLYEANPIFERTRAPGGGSVGLIWGDPSIMEHNGGYRMWLSGGTGKKA